MSLLQPQFMGTHSTAFQPTARAVSQDAHQEKLKKKFEDRNEWYTTQVKKMPVDDCRLSGGQIEKLITLDKGVVCKLQEEVFKLPSEQLKPLCHCMNEQIRLTKNIVETFKPLQSLVQNLEKAKNSLKEGCRVELEVVAIENFTWFYYNNSDIFIMFLD